MNARWAHSWAMRLRRQSSASSASCLVITDEVADIDAAGGAGRLEHLLRRLEDCPMVIAHSLVQEQRRQRP